MSCYQQLQGFFLGGGEPGILSPPEIEYGFVTGIKQQSCPRLRQKQPERI